MVTFARRLRGALVALCAVVILCVPASAQAFEKSILGPEPRDGISPFPFYRDLGVQVLQRS